MSVQQKHLVSHPPFLKSGNTLFARNSFIMLAALFAVVPGIITYGLPALGVVAFSVSTAVFWEYLIALTARQKPAIGDGNSALIGLIFAMMMPATAPWWMILTGTFVAVVMGKMVFGGTGANPFNPAVVSAAVLLVSWPHLLNFTAVLADYDKAFNMVEPLWAVKYFGVDMVGNYEPTALFTGKQAGAIGAVTGAGIVLGGLFLILKGITRWEIPVSFTVGVILTAWLFNLSDASQYAGPVFHLLTGYTLLGAFFLATEDASSPVNPIPMLLYGLGGGFMTVLIRNLGSYVDGVLFAVLLMNLATPILDKIRPGTKDGGI